MKKQVTGWKRFEEFDYFVEREKQAVDLQPECVRACMHADKLGL